MTDTRDPRGIVNFFIRYLVLHAVFLLGFTLSYVTDLFLFYFFGFIGFFTFFQMLIAIPRKFLDEAGSWKPLAIAGALLSDVAVLWWLGGRVSGFLVDSNWELVAIWLPFHFLAAFFAWGLREIFRWLSPRVTATPSAPVDAVDPAVTENPTSSEDADGGMTKSRDPRGIMTFIVRYLVLHVIFLVGLPVSYATDLALIYFFGFMGFITFFQMLIAIPRKFLEKAGSWKPVAIAGALLSDVAVLWWLGGKVSGFLVDSNWELVTIWLHYHFIAALCAWGLREFFHWLDPQRTTTPSTSVSPATPAETENLSESGDTEEDTPTDATAVTEADTDKQ